MEEANFSNFLNFISDSGKNGTNCYVAGGFIVLQD
jgi:hypothetical protein